MASGDFSQDGRVVAPLFPLPNVVLFPRAVLPLHIFEERYKRMTSDALRGESQVAMALLKPGWEKDYYSRPAIEPVVCVGKILTWEKLADGTYNFLLQGAMRGRVVNELSGGSYRQAEIAPMEETPVLEIDLSDHRRRMESLFTAAPWSEMAVGQQFGQMLAGSMTTADIADLMAFNFLDDVPLKQQLLADGDIKHRVERIIASMESLRPKLTAAKEKHRNGPSMN